MKKSLFILLGMMTCMIYLNGQETVFFDFETPTSTATFTYFDNGDFQGGGGNTTVVGNPNPSDVNNSDSVLYFVKGVGGQTWAGAYCNPRPADSIDLTTHNRLKVKVYTENANTLQLKLEDGPGGSPGNWERVVPIPAQGEWVEVEFDVTLPGEAAGANQPAFGKKFANIVIFADFLEANTEQKIVYLDDFGTGTGEAAEPVPISFLVNTAGFSGTVNSVSVAGTFNNWDASASPMTEVGSGSGIYITTADIVPGVIEYKFVINGSSWEEGFSGTDVCVVNNGGFINRTAAISGAAELPTVCWNKCYNCGEDVDITFNVGFPESVTVDPAGPFIAGGNGFEAPGGKYVLSDGDGDGVYSMTINRGFGFSSHFTLASGPCADYSCKENVEGQDCADANNFNDRLLGFVSQDTVISVCFGDCTGAACILSNKTLDHAGFSIAPNPASNLVALTFDQPLNNHGQVTVTSILGTIVLKQNYQRGDEQVSLDVSTLEPGMYMVSYIKDHKIGTQVFLKQ